MKKVKFVYMTLSVIIVGSLGLTSCDKKSDTPNPVEVQQHFAFVNYLDGSAYVGTFGDLESKTADNRKAYEFGFGCYLFPYKNTILMPEGFGGSKVHKFTRDSHGELVKEGYMTFEQDAYPGEVTFTNDGKRAYVVLHGRGKIVLINTATLEKEDEIDLSAYAKLDNNPDPGCNIIRNGKLYVALNQSNSTHTAVPGAGAEVAIINLETKETSVIEDDRTGIVGLFRHSDVFTDEHGDIYFYSAGKSPMTGEQEGFLRIPKDKDEWDPNYLFNLAGTPIIGLDKTGYNMLHFFYAGNGIVYSCLKMEGNVNIKVLDKVVQAVKIDVWNKTIKKINLPMTDSNGTFAIARYKKFIVFGMTTDKGTGYYTYNTETEECSQEPVVTAVGVPGSLVAFE